MRHARRIARARTVRGAAALLALALLAGCDESAPSAEERSERARRNEGDIVIAAVWPWQAQSEVRYAEGVEMAVEEINAAGGIGGRRLRLLREDDHESVNDGLLIAQRLVEDPDVVAVIGHLQSYISVPAAAIYDGAGLVMLAPSSTDPELTAKGYSRVFRSTFTDEDTGNRMAELAAARGYRNLAIYYIRNPYGRALANAFEERAAELGLTVAARASYDPSQTGEGAAPEATLRDWSRMSLDAVFLAGQAPSAGVRIAEMRQQGITAPVLGGDAMGTPALIRLGGEAAEATVVVTRFHPEDPRAEVQGFVESFRGRFGIPPHPASAAGYDAVRLLAHAMERAGTAAPDAVARELHALRGWKGVTGEMSFDAQGNLLAPRMVMLVVRAGQFAYLSEEVLSQAAVAP